MSRSTFGLAALLALAAATCAAEKERPLLVRQEANGELAGWKAFFGEPGARIGDVWRLDSQGVLQCKGTPKGYLFTEKEYRDFTLTLQWRWPKKPGNGGVLIRMTGANKIWPKSLEAQLNAGQAGDFWGLDGYSFRGPSDRLKSLEHPQFGRLTNLPKLKMLEKPAGQWNHYEIRADGDRVSLSINGEPVNEARGCPPSAGRICLTAEGDPIEFRRLVLAPRD